MDRDIINHIVQHIKDWEGGYVNDPDDFGQCTMSGITISTYQYYFGKDKDCEDLKHLSEEEWAFIFYNGYYSPIKADRILDSRKRMLMLDSVWMSGVKSTIKRFQRDLGCSIDGIVGNETLNAINNADFEKLRGIREKWLIQISEKNKNKKYIKGWLNRLYSI